MKRIYLTQEQIEQSKKILSPYKSYSAFSRNKCSAFAFVENIGIRICPYCNINYIYTVRQVGGKPVIRPDIDHFCPKSIFPDLQLDSMNLVPSCQICNERLKRNILFCRTKYIHPYYDDFDSIMKFRINLVKFDKWSFLKAANITIDLQERVCAKSEDIQRAKNNIYVFKLLERYQQHKDIVINIFTRLQVYNKYKSREIAELIYNGKINYEIPLSFLFPEMNCDINQTSLGKLERDILNEYLK